MNNSLTDNYRFENTVKSLVRAHVERTPYDMGFDCGKYGPNARNCHFSLFSSLENTKEWERGKADGKRQRG